MAVHRHHPRRQVHHRGPQVVSTLSNMATRPPIQTARLVVLTRWEYNVAAKLALLDDTMYSWGHAGPVYFEGREVVTVETLGL